MMTDKFRRRTHFLHLVEATNTEPLAKESFMRPAWQSTLFANSNTSLIVFVNCDLVTDDDFVNTLQGSLPKVVFDVRRVPRFDIGYLSRREVFTTFRSIASQYVDLTSVNRKTASSVATAPQLIGEAIQDAQPLTRKGGATVILVDSNQFSEDYIDAILETFSSLDDEPWDVLRVPYEGPPVKDVVKRDVIFVSHANPANNEFAAWISQQLMLCGFSVWCDIKSLVGGDKFWDEIEDCIRTRAAKVVVIVSRESQLASGVQDEVDLAIRVERSLGLRRFVVPIRLDDLPFSEVRANLGRKNFIDFNENWATGLRYLVALLEKDRVPQLERTHPTIDAYLHQKITNPVRVIDKPETLTTNWLPIIEMPPFVYFYDVSAPTEQIEGIASALQVPYFRHLRLLGVFGDISTLARPADAPVLTLQYKLSTEDFLSGRTKNSPSISARVASNIYINMMRQCWNEEMKRRGLVCFPMASNGQAWYFPLDMVDGNALTFTDQNGKRRRKLIVNWSNRRNVFWHFAVEARPVLGVRPRFVLRQHVIFSLDGRKPFVSKEKMHALRRRFCKSWWNDRWRELLVGFVSWLTTSNNTLSFGPESHLTLDTNLLTLLSPVSLEFEDTKLTANNSEDTDDGELSLDDNPDEDDELLGLEGFENSEAVD